MSVVSVIKKECRAREKEKEKERERERKREREGEREEQLFYVPENANRERIFILWKE